jgi:hypothetical protein
MKLLMHQSCILNLCCKTLNQEIFNSKKNYEWSCMVCNRKKSNECMDDIYRCRNIQK